MPQRILISPVPQASVAVVRHVYLMDVLLVDVLPPHHMIYLLRCSVAHSLNTYTVLLGAFVACPPSSDLHTRSGLTIHASDVVEYILDGAILVVLDEGQHVRCM
jgi:hypothetical protein